MSETPESAAAPPQRARVKKGRCCCCLFFLLILPLIARAIYSYRDRAGGYSLDLSVKETPGELRVGFGRTVINPDMTRRVWIAGFSHGRAATAIHDDLFSVASVFDDGTTRVGVIAIDAIGFFHDDVIALRRRIPKEWKLNYTIVASTHNHNTPDLLGLWGPTPLQSGVDPVYREHVISSSIDALGSAVKTLAPADLRTYELAVPTEGLVEDTRKPEVFDASLRVLLFREAGGEKTLGSIVTWANHPETPWSKNTEITADFPGFLREGLEHGLHPGHKTLGGLGGTHLYLNGAVGGLMTTSPRVTVKDPLSAEVFQAGSHAKSRAVGYTLAKRILEAVRSGTQRPTRKLGLGVEAKTIALPITNPTFLAAPVLGVLDRGHVTLGHMRTEVALVTLGPASLLCIPGEIYPELVNGGVENAPGGDYGIAPLEIPPLRELMPGTIKLVLGLANDEIGYIIPKSEWDQLPPYIYGSSKPVYGEMNSLGPNTASLIHKTVGELIQRRTP
jgi:hypothetical protein